MGTLQRHRPRVKTIERVLYSRPYIHRQYYDLAAYLFEREYTTAMRDRIIDWLTDGGTVLRCLVDDGTLEPEHLAGATEALESGRRWHAARAARASSDVPPGPDPDPTADADGNPVAYGADDREPPEEYVPTDADWAAVREADAERERIDAMREWHNRNDFHSWLESQGGPA